MLLTDNETSLERIYKALTSFHKNLSKEIKEVKKEVGDFRAEMQVMKKEVGDFRTEMQVMKATQDRIAKDVTYLRSTTHVMTAKVLETKNIVNEQDPAFISLDTRNVSA